MKTTMNKLRKIFSEDEIQNLCKIGLLTCDTQELIIMEDDKDLPLVNAGRICYVLDPFTNGILDFGEFDGEYVNQTNVYSLLMFWNYPELILEDFSEDFVEESGEMLFDGHCVIDVVTGKKYVHSTEGYSKTCFPDIEVIEGTYNDTFFDNDDRTIFELFEAERLVEVLVSDIYPVKFPLKLSFNKDAKYDECGPTIGAPVIEYIEVKAVDRSKRNQNS
jgi:hypothetical protein